MIKKTIKFKDLDGNDVTEDFYFNLNKAELTEMELTQKGGMSAYLEQIVEAKDIGQLIILFKRILIMSVGKRSEDNRRFIKNQDVIDEFIQSDAYSEMFMELATQTEAAIEFIRGVMPADLEEKVSQGQPVNDVKLPSDEEPAWIKEGREPNETEIREATPAQLRLAYTRKMASKPTE